MNIEENIDLESRINALIQEVENEPEQWYKLLIEKLVKQEVMIETLTDRINELEKYEQFNSAIIDSSLLDTPAFFRDEFEIRATHNLLPDEGFYNEEVSGAGFTFRWTKQDFYFELPIKRDNEKSIQLQLASAIKPELLDEIKCYANGVAVPLKKLSDAQEHIYEGIMPQSDSNTITRVSFHAKASYSPKELNPDTADSRKLAVTFKQLSIK